MRLVRCVFIRLFLAVFIFSTQCGAGKTRLLFEKFVHLSPAFRRGAFLFVMFCDMHAYNETKKGEVRMIGVKKKEQIENGLRADEVEISRAKYGSNDLTIKKKKSFVRQLLSNFSDPIIRILLIALVANIIILGGRCNWFETGGILLAVCLSTFVSTLSEWGSERAFEKLSSSGGGTCRVMRDGNVTLIPARDVVVGDILMLSGGEMIQADAQMLSGEVHVDQSALNGESLEVVKSPDSRDEATWDPMHTTQVFRGTLVSSGEGRARVARVGEATLYGTLASDLQTGTRESPLKVRLANLAHQISRIGYVMAALVAVAYLFNAFFLSAHFSGAEITARFADRTYLLSTLIHTITLVITVIVVAVPEGLPMMITVVLSSNMRRMLRDHVLVRKMVGIETAGSLNILFTDKTGTLTTGKMSVVGVLSGDGVEYRGVSAIPNGNVLRPCLTESARWNTDSSFDRGQVVGGNATDRALLAAFCDTRESTGRVLRKLPFDSRRKFAAVETENQIYIKGAPDVLLPSVSTYLMPNGTRVAFDRAASVALTGVMHRHAARGERLIAVCLADSWQEEHPASLCLVGIVVLRDRVRREAHRAVQTLHRAGVQVVMVTGDGYETAVAIASECGILGEQMQGAVFSGRELASMTDEELCRVIPTLRVIYRALPQDKTRLVRAAQSLELVTGMTGDGINDAPSLKLADVGFAIGSGTDIAREAGDIVILDDNIASICRTVLYGRTTFKSIRKFITFQLTMNLCAVGVSLLGQFIGIESPVTIIQMLWINIIMDTLGGLAFAGEAPALRYMKEKPKRREEPILSGATLNQICITGTYTLGLCVWFLCSPSCAAHFAGGGNETYFLTLFFALFVFAGLANCICARSERMNPFSGIGGNVPFVCIMLFIAAVQVAMIYFGGTLFRTTPVAMSDLVQVILLAMTVLPVDLLRRVFYRLRRVK